MNKSSYKTVKYEAEEEYIVKKSKFIGYIMPVKSSEDALEFIQKISKKHWDATHNVYAYIIRDENVKRFSDDGEPQGTAGMPVLDVLEKNGLTDCVVVVTRYFGGIMLGAGGLVRAYSHSASIAVNAGAVITMALCAKVKVACDYNFYGKLSSVIAEENGKIISTAFEDNVTVEFILENDKFESFNSKLIDSSNGRFNAEKTDEFFSEI